MEIHRFFFEVCMCFFLKHSPLTGVRLWQMLVKIIFRSLFGNLLNHLFRYTNKNIAAKPPFNLHQLNLFQLPFTKTIKKNCSVHEGSCCNNSPNSFGFSRKHFGKFKKKIKLLFTSLESVCFGKNCALRLKYWCARPWAQSYPMNNIFITDL